MDEVLYEQSESGHSMINMFVFYIIDFDDNKFSIAVCFFCCVCLKNVLCNLSKHASHHTYIYTYSTYIHKFTHINTDLQ